jgi:hypothetical protein
MPDKPDLGTMLAASLMGRESQENITYNAHTQVWVQILQALGLVLAIAALLAGLWLLAGPILWVIREVVAALDRLIVSLILATAAIVAYGLTGEILESLDIHQDMSDIWWTVIRLFVVALVLFLALNVVEVLAAGWTSAWTLRLLGGIGLSVSGLLLSWRFTNELWNPLYPKSPMISILQHYLESMIPHPQVEIPGPRPVRINGQVEPTVREDQLERADDAGAHGDGRPRRGRAQHGPRRALHPRKLRAALGGGTLLARPARRAAAGWHCRPSPSA